MQDIRKAAILGSGVMGAAIAAHLANVGIECLLLDIVPDTLTEQEKRMGKTLQDRSVRDRFARLAVERLLKEKPSPLYTKHVIDRIRIGNMSDDSEQLGEVDWIIEAVVENLQIKQQVYEKVESVWQAGTIVSSNTSGISIRRMVEDRSLEFRRHFLGTHFFNPPRYMKLLELIPTEDTHPDIIQRLTTIAERRLGKGVVIAKDTPNFIANRIGIYGLLTTFHHMKEAGLTVDQVDAITGPALGRPKSATFRTLDLVGLDTFVHVSNNVKEHVDDPEEKQLFTVPDEVNELVANRRLGQKSGQGFYKKITGEDGSTILRLNLQTMDYEPGEKLSAPSLEAAKRAKGPAAKIKTLLSADDVTGTFAWNVTKKVLLYSAAKIPEIADDIVAIDRAMRWGFNWDFGPFELWDLIGVRASVERMKREGETIPHWIEQMLASGRASFYEDDADGRQTVYIHTGERRKLTTDPRHIPIEPLKKAGKVIKGNKGASLIDIGDDVALLEFHSPNNAIAMDIMVMVQTAVQEVSANYRGLVIGNEGRNFCVGANLMMILMEAQEQNWSEIDWFIRQFQQMVTAIKSCPRPVVAAPFAMTLGGGAEVCFPADRIQAAAETYIGLVEVGVGLIPAGGGTKEMLIRLTDGVDPKSAPGLQARVNQAFERIGMAQVSTSADDAKALGYLCEHDGVTVNREHLLYEAKQAVLHLDAAGYQLPLPKKIPVVGETGYNTLKLGAYTLLQSGKISEHDYKIADKLAYVLAGGAVPEGTFVTEEYLLDLEREAFLSLCGEPKSQARMQHMLLKKKPLRN